MSFPSRNFRSHSTAPSWPNIPTALLQAELARRDEEPTKPECGSGIKGSYNTSAHVFALVLILVLSVIGVPHTYRAVLEAKLIHC
jgi:solute carrier family 39 (zinc transporter), member 1/2/3